MATRLDQATDARLAEIRTLVRSGATERVGKTYRGASGKIEGRHRGGMSIAFPELIHLKDSPSTIAKAIERGRGKIYQRVRREVRRELGRSIREYKRYPQKPVIPAHAALTKKCKLCRHAHGKGEHRFHGPDSYNMSHAMAFSFNPHARRKGHMRKRVIRRRMVRRVRRNPGAPGGVVIYHKVLRIEAQKGPGHRCDAECKKFGHRYFHDFKTKPMMLGLPNGDIVIRSRR